MWLELPTPSSFQLKRQVFVIGVAHPRYYIRIMLPFFRYSVWDKRSKFTILYVNKILLNWNEIAPVLVLRSTYLVEVDTFIVKIELNSYTHCVLIFYRFRLLTVKESKLSLDSAVLRIRDLYPSWRVPDQTATQKKRGKLTRCLTFYNSNNVPVIVNQVPKKIRVDWQI
jgi:hypothetical protein